MVYKITKKFSSIQKIFDESKKVGNAESGHEAVLESKNKYNIKMDILYKSILI